MTLMAGPIDTRVNPTKVNELAKSQADRLVREAPDRARARPLCRRRAQGLSGLRAARRLHEHEHRAPHARRIASSTTTCAKGEVEKAAQTKAFYDEYFAVLDLTAEFYLETVRAGVPGARAAARHSSPIRAARSSRRAIKRTALLTVEGEKDDICAVGQTLAAHDLCSALAALPQAPPHAGRRRPLRRVLRQRLGEPDLSDGEERHFAERLSRLLAFAARRSIRRAVTSS